VINVDNRGIVNLESLQAAITPETQLVSIALANNEIGTIQSLRDIAELIKKECDARLMRGDTTPLYMHTDASQGAGQLDINVGRLGVDLLTLNAGKVYGPKQVGLLWAASHVRLTPLIVGGGQERGIRSGTENVAGTIGFAVALSRANEHRKFEADRLASLRDGLQKQLMDAFPQAVLSGHERHRLASHLHISFPGVDAERMVFALESRGVLIATGSACAANKGTRSHVLTAIGLSPEIADGSLRVTLGRLSTKENTQKAADIIIEELQREYTRTTQ
jgi:cysteine desulfurase